MTLIKTIHDKKNPYVILNKTIINDKRISFKAKGIFFYAFSKPEDWQFYVSDLINQSPEGKTAVRSGLKELENHGYLYRKYHMNGNLINGYDWYFFETPKNEDEFKEMFPTDHFSVAGDSIAENQPLLSNEEPNKEENNNSPSGSAAVFPSLQPLDIPKKQKEIISHLYSEEWVDKAVKYATNPSVKLIKGLVATIKWFCKEKPDVSEMCSPEENKARFEKDWLFKCRDIEGGDKAYENWAFRCSPRSVEIASITWKTDSTGREWGFQYGPPAFFEYGKNNFLFDIKEYIKEKIPSLFKNTIEV